ncbi:FtsX-like permease family protein [Dissulfurirhabdus thermomarina]|uniref:FtsX-like permease family protein n=1 Tax=Dissulfurirhabdus thermomarina TaxID=1765737 RepID=A0A6N9TQF5_DISTH|nr:ABC transporter permease [Dissulfurirhabdus thermomarina]NDY43502.1 FtsX-like permease family protein [Dissulfurirhabdus thermomarina]NMX22733.1 FtsX-like permease family protein [Dissulfurirhabdus thermomarina]
MRYPVSIARKNLFHDRVRLSITLVGISFSVVLVLVQVGVYLGMMDNAASLITHTDADIWITARNNRNFDFALPFPEYRENRAKAVPGVASVKKLIMVWSLMKLRDGGSENVELVGFDPDSGAGGPWDLVEGRLADVKYHRGVIVDESSFSKLGRVRVGEYREIIDKRVRVVGICRGAKRITTAPILFASYKTAQELTPWLKGQTVFLLVKVRPGADVRAVRARLAAAMDREDVYTREEFAAATRRYWTFNTGMGVGFGFTVLMGLLVGAVIVSQTIYGATMEHLREFGTLKALGAENRTVYGIILRQALLSGWMGYGIGLAANAVVIHFYRAAGQMVWQPWQLFALDLGLTLAMCAGASLVSVRRAMQVDPVEVFRA